MENLLVKEVWREAKVINQHCFKKRYAVSSWGRLKSYSENFDDGQIIKGSLQEGYPILRMKKLIPGTKKHRNFAFLIHKVVAEAFLHKPSEEHCYVAHLDYNKLNNRIDNLKWVTQAEMNELNNKNPRVLATRGVYRKDKNFGHKLTSTDVIRIKKMLADLNRKTRIKIIAKQFGVSEMQIFRIQSGENWGHIKI
jgi:hypothetical protein